MDVTLVYSEDIVGATDCDKCAKPFTPLRVLGLHNARDHGRGQHCRSQEDEHSAQPRSCGGSLLSGEGGGGEGEEGHKARYR